MIEAVPLAPPLVLAALMLGGLALRHWGARRLALLGTGMIWLALAVAVAWFVSSLMAILPLLGG